jgi:hypothetical protein
MLTDPSFAGNCHSISKKEPHHMLPSRADIEDRKQLIRDQARLQLATQVKMWEAAMILSQKLAEDWHELLRLREEVSKARN